MSLLRSAPPHSKELRGYVKGPLCKHIIPLDISFDFRDWAVQPATLSLCEIEVSGIELSRR